jgi:hypothetical protein
MAEFERLLVRNPFLEYEFGDRITDPEVMREVLLTHPDHVLRERLVVEDSPGARATEDPAAGTVEPLSGAAAEASETLETAAKIAREVRAEAPAERGKPSSARRR